MSAGLDMALDDMISSRQSKAGGGGGGYKMNGGGGGGAGRRCYVNNLSWQTSWQDLKDHFRTAGNVVHAKIMEERPGRSKGCGIVEFETAEEAANAIETLNGTDLGGRDIFVREDKEDKAGGGPKGANRPAKPAKKRVSEDRDEVVVARRVYVGNLSWGTAWQDLKDHFGACGTVVYADVMKEPSGRSKGCGIVEFEDPAEAAAAIETLNDSELDGRPLQVREDREDRDLKGAGARKPAKAAPQKKRAKSNEGGVVRVGRRCYVGNLAYRTSWQDLKDHFCQCGNVVHAKIMEERPGRSKGCGIVEFESPDEAIAAIEQLNDTDLGGRPIQVREDREDRDLQ
eukprot:CAMPEP_0119261084 /NCGR_PEP_ID=MMETSP1329-20130426/1247_1 /TAXON_ID=114041 /ORGANISM="Genus nov. species nov., Strain RCC1024" /LENGTH=341 /DNA_ID=CAMNT_0007260581 /DNA_START=36 /DNA_END=1061 /DNA_ORIENTATION=-